MNVNSDLKPYVFLNRFQILIFWFLLVLERGVLGSIPRNAVADLATEVAIFVSPLSATQSPLPATAFMSPVAEMANGDLNICRRRRYRRLYLCRRSPKWRTANIRFVAVAVTGDSIYVAGRRNG